MIISNIQGVGEVLIKHLDMSSDKRNQLNTGQKLWMFGQGQTYNTTAFRTQIPNNDLKLEIRMQNLFMQLSPPPLPLLFCYPIHQNGSGQSLLYPYLKHNKQDQINFNISNQLTNRPTDRARCSCMSATNKQAAQRQYMVSSTGALLK